MTGSIVPIALLLGVSGDVLKRHPFVIAGCFEIPIA